MTDLVTELAAQGRTLPRILLISFLAGCFATVGDGLGESPGFLMGIWHGILAPWTLLIRIFLDIRMYAFPNSGWGYDAGFMVGVLFSPVGGLAAIIAVVGYLFT